MLVKAFIVRTWLKMHFHPLCTMYVSVAKMFINLRAPISITICKEKAIQRNMSNWKANELVYRVNHNSFGAKFQTIFVACFVIRRL